MKDKSINGLSLKVGKARKYKKWINLRVSTEFYKALLEHPTFKNEPRCIVAAFTWLNCVSSAISQNHGEPVPWYSVDIRDRFRPYSATSYRAFVKALEDLGLVVINHKYFFTRNKTGQCKQYFLTSLCYNLLLMSNLQWFKRLHTDKGLRRQVQKNISKSKVRHRPYGDPSLQVIHDLLIHLEFDYEAVLKQLSEEYNNLPPDTLPYTLHYVGDERDKSGFQRINAVLNLLITIKTKDFKPLERNEADGRVWNEFTALKAGYRQFFRYKHLRYVSIIDMRACHFAFLGLFLSELYHEQKQRPTDLLAPFDLTVDIIKTIPNPVNPHWKPIRKIVGTKTKPNPNDNFLAIASDLGKWVDMFSGEQDPRIEIAQFCGWTTEQAKNNVNAWLNGNKRYKRLNRWLGKEFPALSMVWHSLEEKKIVGQTIADEYETPVFLDIGLYEYASDRGLKLSYEYDGVGVFGDVKDPLLEQNISAVDHYIQTQIAQRLGIENGQHLTKRK